VRALSLADLVILLPIYAAREKNESGVSAEGLAAALKNGRYAACAEDAFSILAHEARAGDLLVLMGAGSIRALTDELPCEP
jgi:UDP-N-acetylmuramate--alanine ligase